MASIKFIIIPAFAFLFVWFAVEQTKLAKMDYSNHFGCITEKYNSIDVKFKNDSIDFIKKIQNNSKEIKKDLVYLQKVDVLIDSIIVKPKDKRKGDLDRQLKEVKKINHK